MRQSGREAKAELLNELVHEVLPLLQKPAQRFLQLDGFTNCASHDSMTTAADEDGDTIMLGFTRERMSTPSRDLPVRVLIHEDADREDVRRLLSKMLDDIEGVCDDLQRERERELLSRAGVEQEPPF